ncbi:MAG: TetR/AcrR family transcriptional regulator [Candidatus Acidulodesulfobacterium sp.]
MLKREEIIDAAYNLLLEKGYEGMGIQDILDKINATKGCIYYHFKSKRDIAAAVIEEVIKPAYSDNWSSISNAENPISAIIKVIDDIYRKNGKRLAKNGCPVGNLMLELSAKDEILAKYINEVIDLWHGYIKKALENAVTKKIIDKNTDVKSVASFIIGSFEGCIMLSKSSQSEELLKDCFYNLKNYLLNL